ncbi:MAG TPA: hypothetical protein VEA39_07145 [Methylophilaceae bacterium]|nr:hypothetical protein [Methylophilaceae bacterium]
MPDLRITIRSSVPLSHLRSRIPYEFHYLHEGVDPGMQMVSALEVDAKKSFEAYTEFHADWETRITSESRLLAGVKPDVVLTNVAYLPLEGAARLGIPAVAMCSLNWADIFSDFCGDMPGADKILRQIQQAYRCAEAFLRLTPAMPMSWLSQQHTLGPIAESQRSKRSMINGLVGLSPTDKLVLVSMGGIAMQFPVDAWPQISHVKWLVPDNWQTQRDDCIPINSLGLDFADVLASCDLLLTKPGYGSFVEAACTGIPLLYVKREAWPEQDALIDWLKMHGLCEELDPSLLQTGQFEETLNSLLNEKKPQMVEATGTQQAVNHLVALLTNQSLRSISIASP